MPSKIHIGTSGWSNPEWKGKFYPTTHQAKDFFSFYVRHFDTVEINSSFYHLPLKKTLEKWYTESPSGYIFSIKASRYITHIKKLSAPKETIQKFFDVLTPLKEKTGPILFQLPPNYKSDPLRLKDFFKALPKDFKYTFELRNPDWLNPDIYKILKDHNAAFCIYDFDKRFSPVEVTADFIYMRLHGPNGKYKGSYSAEFLKQWSKQFKTWQKEGKEIYCYFDNTMDASAIKNAELLIKYCTE